MTTFKEWWRDNGHRFDSPALAAERAWEKRVPEGYLVVPVTPSDDRLEDIAKHYGWNRVEVCDAYYALTQTLPE